MKKISLYLLFLILLLMYPTGNADSNAEIPQWIQQLHSVVAESLQAEVSTSHARLPDRIAKGKTFMFCLKGHGSLEKIPDPFEAMEGIFRTNGWKYVPRYQADGHGSTVFAYERGDRLCEIRVNVDSACDDEETGHIPSEFWFEIYCRDK